MIETIELLVEPKEDSGELTTAWAKAGITYSQRMFIRDDAHSAATILSGFILKPEIFVAAIGLAGGWLVARQSRKVRIKIDDMEIEAATVKELEEIIRIVKCELEDQG